MLRHPIRFILHPRQVKAAAVAIHVIPEIEKLGDGSMYYKSLAVAGN